MARKKVTRLDAPPALARVFTHQRLADAWKKTVRTGLRNQPIDDLHDYLDYHRNIKGIARRVRNLILDGLYRPRSPIVVTLEKGNGICRRIVMPAPEDALALQALVDFLEPLVESQRPSASAFYSRSHDFPTVERVDGTFSYPWWLLWPEFQKRIWNFAAARPWTVVTDVANYYDTIPLDNLRQQVAKLTGVEGPVLDFLFFILEAFVWRPDYIPHPGVGLPQVNFDTPRLLAHAYLYPADTLLQKHVGDDFVRWMDDIDFGVDDKRSARTVLKELDQILASYGIRLNSGKTRILSQAEAARHFWMADNRALGTLQSLLKNGVGSPAATARIKLKLEQSYAAFSVNLAGIGRQGQWAKVFKRYLNLLGQVQSTKLEQDIGGLLHEHADLRPACLRYLERLGYTPARFQIVENFIVDDCVDDATLFAAVQLLLAWRIPANSTRRARAVALAEVLGRSRRVDSFVKFLAGLWLMTKYASPAKLGAYVRYQVQVWTQHEWAARQVAAASPLLPPKVQSLVRTTIAVEGLFEGAKLLAHLASLTPSPKLDKQLSSYLLPSAAFRGDGYPLAKVVLIRALASGALPATEVIKLKAGARAMAKDPVVDELLA